MRNPIIKRLLSHCQQGVTLIELIVAMVIISIAMGGILVVMNFTTRHSADPMIQHQAVAIAEAYMEEILLQMYDDPDGTNVGETRSTYDNVDDYIVTDSAILNQKGVEITALNGYTVTVEVSEIENDKPDALGLNGKFVDSKKITVTIIHSAMGDMELVGYRTKF